METTNFLTSTQYNVIKNLLPEQGWQDAKVYSMNDKKSYVNGNVRKSQKNFEKRKDIIKTIKNIVMKPLKKWLKESIENYQYVWMRYNHTEWIRYYEGDFFKSHKDFEKYICNGMIPYVLILGLNDVEEGGETRVEDKILNGSCRENGAVLFQGNLEHESLVVKKGIKIGLKLEFFIYVGSDFTRVCDENKKWTSYWSSFELNLFDNYFKSHSHFKNTKDLILSEDLAKESHNLNLMIADPKLKLPCEIELLFPSFTTNALHDIFNIHNFIKDSSQKLIFCNDPIAWDYINSQIEFPSDCGLFVGLWTKKYSHSDYDLTKYYDREGQKYDFYYYKKEKSQYVNYDSLKIKILNEFLNIFDKYGHKNIELILKDGKIINKHYLKYSFLNQYKPSDSIQKPIFEKGKATITEKEFCNDEESGYDYYTYTEYQQYYIQIRFALFRL
jgi:hypothetical protein